MKNLKLILLALLVSASASWAGNDPKKTNGKGSDSKLSIGIAVGAGIPMGNFGKKDTLASSDTTHTTGWAKTGFHFNVSAGYNFSDKAGVMLQIGGNMNGFDAAGLKAKVDPNGSETFKGTSYYVGQYLVGPYLSLPAGDKVSINIKLLVGMMGMKYATLTESGTFLTTSYSSEFKTSSVSCFGYDIGASFNYGLSDKMGLKFGLDYFGGKPVYTTTTQTSTIGSSTNTTTETYHKVAMSTSIVNISVGIVLHL